MTKKKHPFTEEMIEEFLNGLYADNQKHVDYLNVNSEFCMAIVQEDGSILQYVKKQTPEICMAAVQQDGYILQHVKKQTPEICMAAVQQNGLVLQFVKEQTSEICMAAVRQKGIALKYVKEQTSEIIEVALHSNPSAKKIIRTEHTPYEKKELSFLNGLIRLQKNGKKNKIHKSLKVTSLYAVSF